MPGTLSQADLVADLKVSLHDSADIFSADDSDFKRILDVAALDMGRVRPRTLLGSITLVPDQYNYPAPADILSFKSSLWGAGNRIQPWERNWPGKLPQVQLATNGATRELQFSPAPSSQQIGSLGSIYRYYYFAGHTVGVAAEGTTIQPGDRGLLLLRAQAEALKEMAMRNINKPATMRDGISNMTRNGTPAYLFETLMKMFEEA